MTFGETKTKKVMKNIALILCLLILLAKFEVSIAQENKIITTEVIGKGKPMILIHGMACSAAVWNETIAYYKDKYQLHVVTTMGFGNDGFIETPNFLAQMRDEIIAYIRNNKLKDPILMGHSMGGFLSLWVAATIPNEVGSVISVDGVPFFPVLQMPGTTVESAKLMAGNMRKMMENMDSTARGNNQKMMIASMIATESKREKVIEMGMKSNSKMIGQAFYEMYTTDLRADMEKIKAPVLVLGAWYAYRNYGATREITTVNYESQTNNIPKVKLAIADTAYHFIFYDEPQWFYSQVNEFLGQ
jgi:pimeloyl-ACP methyl ester carboxylesterase